MAQPKSSRGRGGSAVRREDDSAARGLSAVRDVIARGVMVPVDRVQEALDDAVRRGRMTRTDAEALLQSLVNAGRREVDRARRAAGLGSSFPISGYDDLTAGQITTRLDDLTPAELRTVRDYERKHGNRKTVLSAIERKLS